MFENFRNAIKNTQETTKQNLRSLAYTALFGASLLSPKSLDAQSTVMESFECGQYFEIDNHKMSPEQEQEIKTLVSYHLSDLAEKVESGSVDPEKMAIAISASSDERPTNSYQGGNLELTQKRLSAIQQLVENILNSPNFAGEANIGNVTIIPRLPETHEPGVTSATEVINRATNALYMREEFEKLSIEEKENVYDRCRYVRIEFISLEKTILESQQENLMELMGNYPGGITIAVDASPSMQDDFQNLGKYITKKYEDNSMRGPITLYAYSDVVNLASKTTLESPSDVSQFISTHMTKGGSPDEKQSFAAGVLTNEIRKKNEASGIHENKKQSLFVMTDEPVSDITPEKILRLKEMSKGIDLDIAFLLLHPTDGRMVIVYLGEIDHEVQRLQRELATGSTLETANAGNDYLVSNENAPKANENAPKAKVVLQVSDNATAQIFMPTKPAEPAIAVVPDDY